MDLIDDDFPEDVTPWMAGVWPWLPGPRPEGEYWRLLAEDPETAEIWRRPGFLDAYRRHKKELEDRLLTGEPAESLLRDTPEATVREVREPCRLTERERAESARLLASVEGL